MTSRRTTVIAVLASATIAGIAIGAVSHQLGQRDTPTAVGSTTPSSTRSGPAAPKARAPLSEANLLVANDYLDAGWATARVRTGQGRGQATISRCQRNDPQQAEDIRAIFSGYAEDSSLLGNQYAMEFASLTGSQNMDSAIQEWRTACADAPGMKDVTVSAGRPVQVRLSDSSQAQYWKMTFTTGGSTVANLVGVVRTGKRVSVVVVEGPPNAVGKVDGAVLVTQSAVRLG